MERASLTSFDVPPAKALVLGGKVRAFGVTTLERAQALLYPIRRFLAANNGGDRE